MEVAIAQITCSYFALIGRERRVYAANHADRETMYLDPVNPGGAVGNANVMRIWLDNKIELIAAISSSLCINRFGDDIDALRHRRFDIPS